MGIGLLAGLLVGWLAQYRRRAELGYNAPPIKTRPIYPLFGGASMSQQNYNDGLADAFAATAIIAVVVATAVYWLSGMPA